MCASYASVLAQLVQKCGGGHGAPAIKALDAMSKRYSESRVFGESFLTTIVNAELPQSATRIPRVLLAMIYVNMIAVKDPRASSSGLLPPDVRNMTKNKAKELIQLEVDRRALFFVWFI